MKCPNCGRSIADDSQFCEYCGVKINLVPVVEKKSKNYKLLWISLVSICASVLCIVAYNQYENVQRELAEARQRMQALEQHAEEMRKQEESRKADEKHNEAERNPKEEEHNSQAESKEPKENGMVILSDKNFDDFIALSYSKPIIVDFYADWCPPCRKMTRTMMNLAKSYRSELIIGRYDIEKGSVKADEYDVSSIPSVYFIRNGQILKHQIGLCEESEMKSIIMETFGL